MTIEEAKRRSRGGKSKSSGVSETEKRRNRRSNGRGKYQAKILPRKSKSSGVSKAKEKE